MSYSIEFSKVAIKGIAKLKKSEPQAFKKLVKLIEELKEHPKTGTGHPNPLGQDRVDEWSRKISDKHRLVYAIEEERILVFILTVYGHYEDK